MKNRITVLALSLIMFVALTFIFATKTFAKDEQIGVVASHCMQQMQNCCEHAKQNCIDCKGCAKDCKQCCSSKECKQCCHDCKACCKDCTKCLAKVKKDCLQDCTCSKDKAPCCKDDCKCCNHEKSDKKKSEKLDTTCPLHSAK